MLTIETRSKFKKAYRLAGTLIDDEAREQAVGNSMKNQSPGAALKSRPGYLSLVTS
jgi:hypothetical protein